MLVPMSEWLTGTSAGLTVLFLVTIVATTYVIRKL